MTVSGLTITRVWRQPGHRQDRMTQKTLSAFRSNDRGLFRFRTATCCRRARISVWSAARSAKISMILCMPERVSGGDAKFQGFCDRWNKWEGQVQEGRRSRGTLDRRRDAANGAMEPPSPGARRRCRHDRITTSGSVPPDRSVVHRDGGGMISRRTSRLGLRAHALRSRPSETSSLHAMMGRATKRRRPRKEP